MNPAEHDGKQYLLELSYSAAIAFMALTESVFNRVCIQVASLRGDAVGFIGSGAEAFG